MTPNIPSCRSRIAWRRMALALLVLGLLGVGGCAQIARVLGNRPPEVKVTPPPAASKPKPPPKPVDNSPVPSLDTIIVDLLQQGHYDKGKYQLNRYLKQHPDDRAARDMWRQLTENPDKILGSRSRIHVVKPGESYSILAARYAGGANRFLALARYNDAANPSVLQVGQRVRVPLDVHPGPGEKAARKAVAARAAERAANKADDGVGDATMSKAERLQQQSLALLSQGHHAQAMGRLGQALDLDPKLKPSDSKANDLRQELLASYHQRAIVLYRDQKLNQAIGLWDKILSIDPNYEPAIIYRARARELQSRLKQL